MSRVDIIRWVSRHYSMSEWTSQYEWVDVTAWVSGHYTMSECILQHEQLDVTTWEWTLQHEWVDIAAWVSAHYNMNERTWDVRKKYFHNYSEYLTSFPCCFWSDATSYIQVPASQNEGSFAQCARVCHHKIQISGKFSVWLQQVQAGKCHGSCSVDVCSLCL